MTKKMNVKDGDIQKMDPKTKAEEAKKLHQDNDTITEQLKYPLLKPIAFSNAFDDDYLNSGVW